MMLAIGSLNLTSCASNFKTRSEVIPPGRSWEHYLPVNGKCKLKLSVTPKNGVVGVYFMAASEWERFKAGARLGELKMLVRADVATQREFYVDVEAGDYATVFLNDSVTEPVGVMASWVVLKPN